MKGRSFRGQNLAGADFSGAKLHGADFRGADLTEAAFVGVKTGITWPRSIGKLVLGIVSGVVSGLLSGLSLGLLVVFSKQVLNAFRLDHSPFNVVLIIAVYILINISGVLLSLNRQHWKPLWICQIAIILVAVAVAVALAGAGAVAEAGAGAVAVALAGAVAVAVAGAVVWLVLGGYLNWRGFKREEALLLPLRQLSLAWQCWGGSDFRGATLTHADFSQTNLRQARFNDTALIGCR